jgi:hypothetical protein
MSNIVDETKSVINDAKTDISAIKSVKWTTWALLGAVVIIVFIIIMSSC